MIRYDAGEMLLPKAMREIKDQVLILMIVVVTVIFLVIVLIKIIIAEPTCNIWSKRHKRDKARIEIGVSEVSDLRRRFRGKCRARQRDEFGTCSTAGAQYNNA